MKVGGVIHHGGVFVMRGRDERIKAVIGEYDCLSFEQWTSIILGWSDLSVMIPDGVLKDMAEFMANDQTDRSRVNVHAKDRDLVVGLRNYNPEQ